MTCAPVDHFAIDFDSSSEMIAPTNPNTNENTSSEPTLMPFACTTRSRPNKCSTTDRTSTTARFVMRKRTIRFMLRLRLLGPAQWYRRREPLRPARFRPRIFERYGPVEHRMARIMVDDIGDEVAVPFELNAVLGQCSDERGLDLRRDHAF